MTKHEREIAGLKQDLRKISNHVMVAIHLIDEEMKKPSTEFRGKQIAAITNALEMTNDGVRYGSLKVDFRKDDKKKAVANLLVPRHQAAKDS